MTVRLSKILLVIAAAVLASLVSFSNITDYGTNLTFVRHVFMMDTTFPGNANLYRAVTSPYLQNAGYLLIIACETATALCCWAGALLMWRARSGANATFTQSKRVALVGLTLGFLTWQVAFMSIGGEWFDMWMSTIWNGEASAFRFFTTFLLLLIFVSLDNDEFAK